METGHKRIISESLDFAREKMSVSAPSHGWDHVQRVIALAEKISETEPNADKTVVKLSAILHDISRSDQDSSGGELCHAEAGSALALKFLISKGLDIHTAEHVAECIRTHRYRKGEAPSSIEAKILYDADKLDSIGAVGIGRAFLFSGEIGAKLHNHGADISATSAYTEEDTAYREYEVKLKHVKEKMLTAEGRRLAEERDEFMQIFFSRLKAEISGVL